MVLYIFSTHRLNIQNFDPLELYFNLGTIISTSKQ